MGLKQSFQIVCVFFSLARMSSINRPVGRTAIAGIPDNLAIGLLLSYSDLITPSARSQMSFYKRQLYWAPAARHNRAECLLREGDFL
jgi:hypothetical protein